MGSLFVVVWFITALVCLTALEERFPIIGDLIASVMGKLGFEEE